MLRSSPLSNSKKYIPAAKITTERMRMALETAKQNVVSKKWNLTATRSYLRTEGIRNGVVNHLINMLKQDESEHNLESIVPPSWCTKLNIDAYLETPMHLLFLGVTKTVGNVIKKYSPQKKFLFFTNSIIPWRKYTHCPLIGVKLCFLVQQKKRLDHGFPKIMLHLRAYSSLYIFHCI